MGDEKKKKVAFYDEGIDKTIPDFVDITFHELGKTPDRILEYNPCQHGTQTFGVFYRTLSSLMKQYGSKTKDKEVKDVVEIVDSSYYQHFDEKTSTFTGSHKKAYENFFSSSCNTLNLSIFSVLSQLHYDNNGAAKIAEDSREFKKIHQNGTLIIACAGNTDFISTNDLFPQNDLYVFTVGAIYPKDFKQPDTLVATNRNPSWVSQPGAGVIISSLGRHITYNTQSLPWAVSEYGTDLPRHLVKKYNVENAGKHQIRIPDYVDVSGTSYSCPEITAYKTFIELERPELDRNNVEHLLIAAAEEIPMEKLTDDWERKELSQLFRTVSYNKGQHWNNAGQPVYGEFGLGIINRDRLVHLIKTWGKQEIVEEEIVLKDPQVKYDGQYYHYTFDCNVDNNVYVLSLNIENTDGKRRDVSYLSIKSPQGTESYFQTPQHSWSYWMNHQILPDYSEEKKAIYAVDMKYLNGPINNRFKNANFYGENTKEEWVVKSNVPLEKLEIIMRSTKKTNDNVYRYDDRVLKMDNPKALSDINGGQDTIDVSYYKAGKVEVDLRKDQREIRFIKADGSVAKKVAIAQGTFEKIIPKSALVGS